MSFNLINIGINGFGRIGKCCFYQLINNNKFNIKAININNLEIKDIEKYLNNDSNFGKFNFKVNILDNNYIQINDNIIKIFKTKNANEITWKNENVNYLIESTGVFLTSEKAKQHDVDYIIMSAPPKDIDITKIFCYGVNHNEYNGENVVSAASCTTNCIAPFLKYCCNNYEIDNGNFITIHSATSSQSIVDNANFSKRVNRSIFNNIIPHTTGASKSIDIILPKLNGKIIGTSVRVPTSNVSMVDLNINFKTNVDKNEFLEKLEINQNDIIKLNKEKLVSNDFSKTTSPSIVDFDTTLQLHDKGIKFSLWYDNEYSYCSNLIRLVEHMYINNNNNNKINNCINNINCNNKNVFVRVDYNLPINEKTNEFIDTYRIDKTIKTIKKILLDKPKNLILATHFGRPIPDSFNEKYSTKQLLPILEKKINKIVGFLPDGLNTTNEQIEKEKIIKNTNLFLMENTRFHNFETKPLTETFNINIPIDIFVNEAFSCTHRKHTSMSYINSSEKYYGYQLYKEVEALDLIVKNKKSNILAIIGGNKIDDKIPMMETLSEKVNTIFIAGNNVNHIEKYKDFFEKVKNNKANIIFTNDGMGNYTPSDIPNYSNKETKENMLWFDIGSISLKNLMEECNKADIIFWNGTLGIVEDNFYKIGSEMLYNYLNQLENKKIIIGGGDTAGFVNQHENNNFYHISTGGGASIEYIALGKLYCENN